ncbi:MAG: ASCH domain-containing protein [Planctomycetota bacterium]|jgi:ASC-1-like (ASCH) protein
MANCHLAILRRVYLDAILSGRKTVESRFTKSRRAPFGQIFAGDKIFLKESSGPVCGEAYVSAVEQLEGLSRKKISELREQYNHLILGEEGYWQSKEMSRYGVLIWLEKVREIKPIRIWKKDWRAWVVLRSEEDFGLNRINTQERP